MPASLPSESHPEHLCYTKSTWAGSWTEKSLLQALTITDQAAPGHSSATLRYRYGVGMLPAIGSRAEDSALTTIPRGSLIGHYVKIEVDGLGTWWGVIVDVADERHGHIGGTISSGIELYTAYGLTWLLDQSMPIRKSKVKFPTGSGTIDTAIPFNGGTAAGNRGSKVSWKNYDTALECFTDRTLSTDPAAWTAADAIDYLFTNFPPKNASDSVLITFQLASGATAFLDYELPYTEYEGMTLWQILNVLIDRRRGLGWHASINGSAVEINVWSQNAADITLPGGSTIPQNANQTTLNFDTSVNVHGATLTTTLLTRYDQVLCLGEPVGSVFTVRPATNMEPDWVSADKSKYDTAASQKTGYSALSDVDKAAANADARAVDSLSKVFSWWRPRKQWTGRSDTDPSTGSAPYALPRIDSDGLYYVGDAADIQRAALRFQDYLPLRPNVDYSTTIEPETSDTDDEESDFLPPILLLKAEPIRSSGGDAGWVHCERLHEAAKIGSSKRPYEYSVDLLVRRDAPGLILRAVGAPQHYLSKDKFTPAGDFENVPSSEGFNQNDWLATVYMLQHARCRAQYPLQADLPSLDLVRQLQLNIANAHLDIMIAGTIVGVDAGVLKKSSSGGQIRDDRPRLRDIARMAYAWYGQERRILQMSFRSLDTAFTIGTLVTSVGSGGTAITVNTCITSATYDLSTGMTSISTQFGELDFARL